MSRGALLLDLDGTLVDSIPCWIEAFQVTLETHGIPLSEAEFVATIYQRSRALPEVLRSLGVEADPEVFRSERDQIYIRMLTKRVAWLPDAEALLLATEASAMGIVTNSWRRYVDAIDMRLGFCRHVGCVLAHEDVGGRTKPDPHSLLLAAEQLDADPALSVYVGDQHHDMVAARAAGMQAWLVPAATTPARAHDAADAVFSDLASARLTWTER